MSTSETSETRERPRLGHEDRGRRGRRRHRRLRPGGCHVGDPAGAAGMACGRAGAVGGALPAAPSRALRPRGRPHPAVVWHRRGAHQDQRAGRHLRVPERRTQPAGAVRARRQRPVRLATVIHVLPARARGAAVRSRWRALRDRGPPGCPGDRHRRRRRRSHRAWRTRRRRAGRDGGLRLRADGRGTARPCPLRRRLRRRQQHRAQRARPRHDRPRLLLRLAHRRRDLRRAPHLRPPQRPDLRPRPPDHLRVRRTGTAPLGVHGAARRVDRPAQRRGHRVAAPRTVGRQPEQRPPRAPRRLPVPGPLGAGMEPRAGTARRRRRPSDATLRRPRPVLRPARRRQPGVEARPACSAAPHPTGSSTPTAPSEHPTWRPSSSSPSRWAR